MHKIGDFVGMVEPVRADPVGSWHLAMVRGGREQSVKDFLARHGFPVYFPMTRIMRQVKRREMSHKQRIAGAVVKKAVLRPVFPSYIFVRFDPNKDRYHGFFDAAGVFGLVCKDDQPVAVPAAMVSNMQDQEVDGAIPGPVLLRQLFDVGDKVIIKAGPFETFTAVVEQLPASLLAQLRTGRIEDIDESERASLAVDLFGRMTKVTMPIGNLARV